MKFHVGQRISAKGELCTVRYVGSVAGKPGEFIGVEWDFPDRGKHDGMFEGRRYFTCRHPSDRCASFLKTTTSLDSTQTLHTAIERKYASGEIDFADSISFNTKVVEEKGYEKLAARQSKLQDLKIAVVDNQCLTGAVEGSETRLAAICPKAIELNIAYNLLEDLAEVGNMIDGSQHLKTLSLEGNRLHSFSEQRTFDKITSLDLESMLLLPAELRTILLAFPSIQHVNASRNLLSRDVLPCLPKTIRTANLAGNNMTSLAVLAPWIASCPRLEQLDLRDNYIGSLHDTSARWEAGNVLSSSLTDLDLTSNAIASFTFIDSLPGVLPSLKHLRVSNNTIYTSSSRPSGTILTEKEISLLIIARLPKLQTLNYTTIKAKDRLDAETFYLSLIAEELSLAPTVRHAEIQETHPRYQALCDEYGAPSISPQVVSANGKSDPNSISARVARCHVYFSKSIAALLDDSPLPVRAQMDIFDIPLSFSIYAVIAHVARRYALLPSALNLIWETGERDPVGAEMSSGGTVEEWDSEGEETDTVAGWVEREVKLHAGLRVLGSVLDGKEAIIRVEINQGLKKEMVLVEQFLHDRA